MPNHQFPLYFHEIYSSGLDRTARFPVDRYQLLADKLQSMDDEGLISWQMSRLASREEVQLVHQEDYVHRFLNHQLLEKEIRRIGLRPWKDTIVEAHASLDRRSFTSDGKGFEWRLTDRR